MTFREYDWKDRYVSGRDDVLNDFYIPALERSQYYYRIAGYFNSAVLSAAARGVASFVETGDKMKLAVGAEVSEEDAEAIQRGEETPEEVLERNLAGKLDNVENAMVRDRLGVLAWMVATDQLEIKIGVNLDEEGDILDPTNSLWHEKVVLFEDEEGNQVHVDGSINETASAWTVNRESFSVHRSWIEGQEGYVKSAKEEFEKVWENKDKTSRLFSVPEAIEQEILQYEPREPPTIDPVNQKKEIELWPPQERAIENWEANNHSGIFEMATGTGKTLASLFAADRRFRPEDTLLILVPFKDLIDQWEDELKTPKDKFDDVEVIKCSSDYEWKDRLGDFILRNQNETRDVVITTMDTAINDRFQGVISEFIEPENLLLIVDEVHNIGSSTRSEFLENISAERGKIGLSATPERLWDEEGTEKIFDYFDGKVIEYGIGDAIDPDIDGQRFLTPYEYHIHFVPLTRQEKREYNNITSEIIPLYNKVEDINGSTDGGDETPVERRLKQKLIERANILKNAERKVEEARRILRENNDLERCLVYCSDGDQLEELKDLLLQDSENVCKYTSELDRSQRDDALRSFKKGTADTMVAIKCLDEGVDIPVCDSAIVLSSSRNPREFVQRRGRVLRKSEDKEKAIIHDLVVIPYTMDELKNQECEISDVEYNIMERELERVETFRVNAENSAEVLVQVQDIKNLLKNNLG